MNKFNIKEIVALGIVSVETVAMIVFAHAVKKEVMRKFEELTGYTDADAFLSDRNRVNEVINMHPEWKKAQ